MDDTKLGSSTKAATDSEHTNEFDQYDTWQLTDLATAPDTDPELAERAMVELNRRDHLTKTVVSQVSVPQTPASLEQSTVPQAPGADFVEIPLGSDSETDHNSDTEPAPSSAELAQKSEQLFDEYSELFPEWAGEWFSDGVVDLLAQGQTNLSGNAPLSAGFWSDEIKSIQKVLGSDRLDADQVIDAESELRKRINRQLIRRNRRLLEGAPRAEALRRGVERAIQDGAILDPQTGEVNFTLPIKSSDAVLNLFQQTGLEPAKEQLRKLSHEGFVNIVDAIKNQDPATKAEGFKQLDWYFKNFNYAKHLDELFDGLDGYAAAGDLDFRTTLDDYLFQNPAVIEYMNHTAERDEQTLEALAQAQEFPLEDVLAVFDKLDNHDQTNLRIDKTVTFPNSQGMFPGVDGAGYGHTRAQKRRRTWPLGAEKRARAREEFAKIKELDPNANFYIETIFRGDHKKSTAYDPTRFNSSDRLYAIVRFGYKDANNVIAVPITSHSAAIFCWRGQTGDDREGWRKYFERGTIKTRSEEVKRIQHRGYSKAGVEAIDKAYQNVWDYFDNWEAAA